MFWDNIQRRLTAVSIFIFHAEEVGQSTIAKSAYYRSAIILVASVVEGMTHRLVKKKLSGSIFYKEKQFRYTNEVPSNVAGLNDMVISQRIEVDVSIDDKNVKFKDLNDYLKKHKFVTQIEYEKLEYVRNERNKIHIQGLNQTDTGHTKLKFNKMSEPLDFLSRKLQG